MSASRLAVAAAAAVAASACAVGPDFKTPPAPATTHYTRTPEPTATVAAPGASGVAQTFSSERDIPADWWTLYHSSALDELVRRALTDSPTVQAAQATLQTAVETWKANRGALLLPAVDATGTAVRQKEPGAVFGQPGSSFLFNLFDASVGVTYRLDPFGASRRQVEGFRAQADYQRWEFEAARLTLSANVVTTAVNIASLHAQLGALTDIVTSEREQLKVVQRQFDAGAASRSDVLAQQTQVAQNEAQLPALEKQLAQAQHRLAVLVGRTPADWMPPPITLDALQVPRVLPVRLPS
ncbi:MAG TPA: TolC family protein, partial [Steroidobacteraceae bacterium]|nr:TolC family protein [Steroidobacteraceae bacterium]